MALRTTMAARVVPKRRAMEESVSPGWTVYVCSPGTGVAVALGLGVPVGNAVAWRAGVGEGGTGGSLWGVVVTAGAPDGEGGAPRSQAETTKASRRAATASAARDIRQA